MDRESPPSVIMLTHGALVRVAFTMIRLIDETEGMMEASQRGLDEPGVRGRPHAAR